MKIITKKEQLNIATALMVIKTIANDIYDVDTFVALTDAIATIGVETGMDIRTFYPQT